MIRITNLSVDLGGKKILSGVNLSIDKGERWAIMGRAASGKTSLARAIAGQLFARGEIRFEFEGTIGMVEQQHRFRNRQHTYDFYYQQRFNSMDAENSLTVAELLAEEGFAALDNHWLKILHLHKLLERPLIQLSNGQHKRLQMALALQHHPTVLVLDNPFAGLDSEGRDTLYAVLDNITAIGTQVILVCSPEELPASFTHVAVLEHGTLRVMNEKELPLFVAQSAFNTDLLNSLVTDHGLFDPMIRLRNVHIRYGETVILRNLGLEIRQGERVSISGPNGSGKSTLLSLVTADNPQAYANDIWLFGRKRGTGESIWDIKKNIGFLSPELHLYFDGSFTCFEVVASGLFETIGLFRLLSATQETLVMSWLELFGLAHKADVMLNRLSNSEQRLVLMARTLVKNPALLVLDEPFQGMDAQQVEMIKSLIDYICSVSNLTLIYVSHYRRDFPNCISRFFEMSAGEITEVSNNETAR